MSNACLPARQFKLKNLKKGFSLVTVIFIITVLLIFAAVLSRLVLNAMSLGENKVIGLQSFYLAEAGIEKIKYELKKNPNWYTDLPHSPADDKNWLKNAAKGISESTPTGVFKMVREKDKNLAYAIGMAKNATRIIKIEFEISPFEQETWQFL